MGFLSNHVPGTIELGQLKNHNPYDFQSGFLKKIIFFPPYLPIQISFCMILSPFKAWIFDFWAEQ